MEMMTLTKEQRELKAMAPATAQAAGARVRELTPAQRRAVMFAQQQVLRARAAKKAKDERQAALTRMWQEEDSDRVRTHAVPHAQEQPDEAKEVSLREAIGHVLRDLRTRDHKTLREVSFGVPFRSGARPEGGQFRTAVVHRAVLGAVHSPDASHGG